jgi:hypothetical protein
VLGPEAEVLLRMLQEQVQQQQQQLAAAQAAHQEAAATAAAVPGLQAALTAARADASTSKGQVLELQGCKQQVKQLDQELSLFKQAFKVCAGDDELCFLCSNFVWDSRSERSGHAACRHAGLHSMLLPEPRPPYHHTQSTHQLEHPLNPIPSCFPPAPLSCLPPLKSPQTTLNIEYPSP